MANLNESFGQDVQAEAAQKLRQFQFHGLVDWRCFVPSRLVAEFNRSLCRIQMVQSPVRDRDAMGVSREILENLLGTSEWRFGINIPALGCRFANLRLECPRLGEFAQIVVKLKLSRSEEPLEPSAEFSLEHCRQGDDRKQESFTGCFPIQSVQSHTPAGDNAMDMIMIDQGLTPGMQHQRQSQLNTKIVSTEFQQRLRGRGECLQRWLGPDHRIQRIAHRFQGFSADVQITQSRGQTHVSEQPFDDVYRSSRIN